MGKFKVGDNVKIMYNDINPESIGKIGKIMSVYNSFNDKLGYCTVYRVNVGGNFLKGVACDDDLTLAN